MRRLLATVAILGLSGYGAIACSSGGSSSSAQGAVNACWETGPGIEIYTVDITVKSCGAIMYDGDTSTNHVPTQSQLANMGDPLCTANFPTITWEVWGTSADAESLCSTLQSEQS